MNSESGTGAERPSPRPAGPRPLEALAPALIIFFACFAAAAAGLGWATVAGAASPVWPAAGVAVAGLVLAGRRYWPAIVLARVAAAQVSGAEADLMSQVLMGFGNGAAAAVAATVLLRLSPGELGLRRVASAVGLLVAAVVAALLSALAGVGVLIGAGNLALGSAYAVFLTWFFGDAVGVTIFGALILVWRHFSMADWPLRRTAHLVAVLTLVALLGWHVFFGGQEVRTFYLYPPLVWAAFMLSAPGATSALVVIAVISIAGTSLGHGPFASDAGGDMVLLQAYLGICSLVALLLAAMSEERRTEALQRASSAEALAASRLAELNSLYESAPIGLAFFDREYRYLRINPELANANGLPPEQHIGRTAREVIGDSAGAVEGVIDRVFETGEPVRDVEISAASPADPATKRHWLTGFYPIFDDDGAVEAVGAWVLEISERKAAQEREALLAREVDHRAKNLLAVVQSIVQLTPGDDGPELKRSVVGRIQALARAHSLLSDSRWDGVAFGELVAEELAPFASRGSSRARFEGPALTLRPAAAQSLALVLHELATNAVKYGALSNATGTLAVEWTRHDDDDGRAFLDILWTESGGPPVEEPEDYGFGSNIIRASVERQLRGKVIKQWRPEGLVATLRIPWSEVVRGGDS